MTLVLRQAPNAVGNELVPLLPLRDFVEYDEFAPARPVLDVEADHVQSRRIQPLVHPLLHHVPVAAGAAAGGQMSPPAQTPCLHVALDHREAGGLALGHPPVDNLHQRRRFVESLLNGG